jgi:hypothetical protein
MKTNSSVSVTCTLNASDLMELYENGELKDNGVVIGTTGPELQRFRELLDEQKDLSSTPNNR